MEGPTSKRLHSDSIPIFGEGIGLVLSRWSALQTAVENEWGGHDSRFKAQQLASDVLSWFTHSIEHLYIDDLEDILDEGMLSLNVEVEDGSIGEVAEKLMVIHEECLDGNFKSIEDLMAANVEQPARSQVQQVVNDDDNVEVSERLGVNENDSSSNMMVDVRPEVDSNLSQVSATVNGTRLMAADEDDGWTVVSSRRNRGRRK